MRETVLQSNLAFGQFSVGRDQSPAGSAQWRLLPTATWSSHHESSVVIPLGVAGSLVPSSSATLNGRAVCR